MFYVISLSFSVCCQFPSTTATVTSNDEDQENATQNWSREKQAMADIFHHV
jgi:hypothetical protein